MLPLTIEQMKSTSKMQEIQPKYRIYRKGIRMIRKNLTRK